MREFLGGAGVTESASRSAVRRFLAFRRELFISIVLIVSFMAPPTRLKIFATEYMSMSASVTDVIISSRVYPRRRRAAAFRRRLPVLWFMVFWLLLRISAFGSRYDAKSRKFRDKNDSTFCPARPSAPSNS